MRLALWNTNYFRGFGGAEKAVHNLANRFSQLGIETYLIAERPNPPRIDNHFFGPLHPAVKVYQGTFANPWDWSHQPLTFLSRVFRYLNAAFRFCIFFRRHQTHIIHLHYVSWDVLLLALLKALFRYRLVITFRAGEDLIARQQRLSSLKVRIALKCADRVTAVSKDLCEALKRKHSFEAAIYIPNGLDVDHVRRLATPPADVQPDHFVFCGRMTDQKRVDFLVEAFNECIKRGCTKNLYLVGDGEELSAIKALIHSYGVQDRIITLGALPHAQTLGVINQSRCLVLSSLFEGLPQVALEAMALEKPVITSDVGGLRDMVIHGESGYLYPVNRPDLLCKFIMELCDDGARAHAFGARGLAKLRADYSLDSVVNQYLDLYHSLLDENGAAGVRPVSARAQHARKTTTIKSDAARQ
jgi:glycosyltransferase involved in cell wall biosynthesis